MEKRELEKLRKGMACCIEANQTGRCPPECPYDDRAEGDRLTYCEGVLLLDALRRIRELEAKA